MLNIRKSPARYVSRRESVLKSRKYRLYLLLPSLPPSLFVCVCVCVCVFLSLSLSLFRLLPLSFCPLRADILSDISCNRKKEELSARATMELLSRIAERATLSVNIIFHGEIEYLSLPSAAYSPARVHVRARARAFSLAANEELFAFGLFGVAFSRSRTITL